MSDLRSLFPDSRYNIITLTNPYSTLYVYNTSLTTEQNGGRCCLWTVPTGATWARFEVWGGGGSGAGACCCQHPNMSGGSGTYARKTIRVNPGNTYTICAGGSGCCSCNCCGFSGYPSYACNPSATYPLCICASGGGYGINQCFMYNGSSCSPTSQICGCACGFDFAICGVQHPSTDGTCGYDAWAYAPDSTYVGGGFRISRDMCVGCYGDIDGNAMFPGGGGMGAISNGGSCYRGGFGAGGLVAITYK